jgi:hypothetical protein
MEWQPSANKLIVEVQFDHLPVDASVTEPNSYVWHPDKADRSCTMDQVKRENRSALSLL